MAYMLRKQILPAVFEYEAKLATIIQTKKTSGIDSPLEEQILFNINDPLELVSKHLENLEELLESNPENEKEKAVFAADKILPLMEAIRSLTDTIEKNIPKDFWPLPDYNDMLFRSTQ